MTPKNLKSTVLYMTRKRCGEQMKINKAALQIAREKKLADIVVQMCFLVTILVLHGVFGFGKERLTRFAEKFAQKIKEYRNRYDEVALDALISHAKSLGIEVDWV